MDDCHTRGYWADADQHGIPVNKTATMHAGFKISQWDRGAVCCITGNHQTKPVSIIFYSGGWYYCQKVWDDNFSATVDSILHQPSESNYATFIPFEGNSVNAGAGAWPGRALQLTYYLLDREQWICAIAKPEPHSDANAAELHSSCLERNPKKSILKRGTRTSICYAYLNAWDYYDGDQGVAQDQRFRSFLDRLHSDTQILRVM